MPVLLQISALFIIMTAGFAADKAKILSPESIKGISSFIIKVTLPCLIVVSLQKPFSSELMGDAFKTMFVAFLFYAIIIAFGFLAVKLLVTPKKQVGVFVFSLGFSNAAFIGFPVITSILGSDALFLTSIHNIMFNLLAFSVGVVIVAGSGGGDDSVDGVGGKKPLLHHFSVGKIFNINVIASIVGFILFIASVRIPPVIFGPMEMVGNLTTPLAMIATGAMLSRNKLRTVVGDWRLYAVSLVRLAVLPLITAVVLRFFGISGNLYYISIIIAGMPAASSTSLIAEVYGGDTNTASSIVFMTTLLSVISIPVLALIIQP